MCYVRVGFVCLEFLVPVQTVTHEECRATVLFLKNPLKGEKFKKGARKFPAYFES
jgi:hypothetical protein